MSKILITGDKGCIGTELIALLKGYEILGLDKAHEEMIAAEGVYTKLRRDIAADSIKDEIEAFSPEIVFHLAASFERTKETPEAFSHIWHNDTLGSHRLLEVLRDCESVKTVVFASSYLIYGGGKFGWPPRKHEPSESLSESESLSYNLNRHINPRNLCGISKLYTERELEFLCSSTRPDIRHVNARIFRVYGRGGKEVISRFCHCKVKNWTVDAFNLENRFSFIFAEDVAKGLVKLAFSEAKGVVNLGMVESRSIKEVIDIIGVKYNKLEDDPIWESSAADTTLLKQYTGWEPTIRIEEGIERILEYERNNHNQ